MGPKISRAAYKTVGASSWHYSAKLFKAALVEFSTGPELDARKLAPSDRQVEQTPDEFLTEAFERGRFAVDYRSRTLSSVRSLGFHSHPI